MKKLWFLTLSCAALLAQDSSPAMIIDLSEDEIVIPATQPLEESLSETPSRHASTLPDVHAPSTTLMPTPDVQLSAKETPLQAPTAQRPLISTKIPAPSVVQQVKINPQDDIAAIIKEEQEVAEEVKSQGVVIDLGLVFAGSPTIYSILLILSIASVSIWAYTLLSLRSSEICPLEEFNHLQNFLQSGSYDAALEICQKRPSLLSGMVQTALRNRQHGSSTMFDMMKAEGKRLTASYWQKIGLLNEIAIIAPMLGLLGTVLGMFYAFYDLNRSAESISTLFSGLGISVGTTVGGLIVAILALMFHAITKYRLMKQLTLLESKAEVLAQSIASHPQGQR